MLHTYCFVLRSSQAAAAEKAWNTGTRVSSLLVLHAVILEEIEGLESIKQKVSQVLIQVGNQDAAVKAVRDTPTIHGLSYEVPQGAPRQPIIPILICLHAYLDLLMVVTASLLAQSAVARCDCSGNVPASAEHAGLAARAASNDGQTQHSSVVHVQYLGEIGGDEGHAYSEVCLIEIVRYIPPQLAILTPFLDNSMEEGQNPYQRPERLHAFQPLLIVMHRQQYPAAATWSS